MNFFIGYSKINAKRVKYILHGICTCASFQFTYNPAGHVITGDLNIVDNTSLRNVLSKGPKYREPKSINWKHNFKILMDSVEDYARQWAKREKEDVDTLSE